MQKYLFLSVVIVSTASYLLQDFSNSAPTVQPVNAPEGIFSAERAYLVLSDILKEGVPHPTGSEENRAVRQRILEWLARHDIQSSVQSTWGCSSARGRCSPVHNVIAKIPGKPGNPYVVLMAHYDSTPTSTGAGDNGAGVATILEVGRMLRDRQLVNPVMLLITDAEENGLLGAEAFFTRHADRDNIGVVLNLEASTTTGRSFLFRTSNSNRQLVRAYGGSVSRPGGTSLYNEVFKRMPSDTDLSVPLRLGLPGMDFVFVGEMGRHHTRDDNLNNLDRASLQHHGDNLFPLVRELAGQPLDLQTDDSATFLNLFGIWLSWTSPAGAGLLVIGIGLLGVAVWRTVSDWRQAVAAAALPLALFIAITLVTGASLLLVHLVNGTTPFWPANLGPYRMILFGAPFGLGLMLAPRFNEDIELPNALIGVWAFWGLLAACFTVWLPAAAYLFVLPLCVAGISLVSASFVRNAELREFVYLLPVPLVVALHLNLVLLLEQSQGYWFVAATFIFLALYVSSVMPLVRGQFVQLAGRLMVGVAAVGCVLAVLLPVFSAQRPQTAIYQVVENADTQRAWLQFLSLNAVPDAIRALQPFDERASIFPWGEAAEGELMEIEPGNLMPPSLALIDESSSESDRWITLELSSNREARDLGIVIPPNARAASYIVDEQEYHFEPMDWGIWQGNHALEFRGVQGRTVQLRIRFEDTKPVRAHIYDLSVGIRQEFDYLIEAREPLVVQVHQGDRTMSISEVTF